MVRYTLVHAQTNYHVSQFGHYNQDKAVTYQYWYTHFFSQRYDVTNTYLPLYSSTDTEAVTLSLSKSEIYMVITREAICQGKG
jgi:uncharacterized SAM-dependent methyltransferase